MDVQVWLAIFIILLLLEIVSMALTTIWFAVGTVGALFVSLFGGGLWLQIVVFLTISFVVLIFYRPLAVRYINSKRTATNVEEMVGKEGRVTEKIDNLAQTGRMLIKGMDWSARAVSDDIVIEPGSIVLVVRVEGVRLIVKPLKPL